jgi:hypothetical protein
MTQKVSEKTQNVNEENGKLQKIIGKRIFFLIKSFMRKLRNIKYLEKGIF